MRGIVICVEYDDLLEMTLASNIRYLEECVVVTSLNDAKTVAVCDRFSNVRVHRTDAFTRHGAKFNKGLAMEEGFSVLGRDGWIVIWDADIVFPDLGSLEIRVSPDCLYGPSRLILNDPRQYRIDPKSSWAAAQPTVDLEFPGFFQLFHASCPVLDGLPFWYDPTFAHAGGGDCYFQSLWSEYHRIRLPFNVLHLGPRDANWYGRTTSRLDGSSVPQSRERSIELMALKNAQGWSRKKIHKKHVDRIAVPGYVSTFKWHNSEPPKNQE